MTPWRYQVGLLRGIWSGVALVVRTLYRESSNFSVSFLIEMFRDIQKRSSSLELSRIVDTFANHNTNLYSTRHNSQISLLGTIDNRYDPPIRRYWNKKGAPSKPPNLHPAERFPSTNVERCQIPARRNISGESSLRPYLTAGGYTLSKGQKSNPRIGHDTCARVTSRPGGWGKVCASRIWSLSAL